MILLVKKGGRVSEETRIKLSLAHKGKHHTSEVKFKMSISRMQRKETLGYINSPETREKMSQAQKTRFKKEPMSDETKNKLSLSKKGVLKPPRSEEHKRNLSESGKFPKPWGRGEHCNFWEGGKTDLVKQIKAGYNYTHWREQIFKRDNYTCTACGAKGNLHPHHIVSLSEILIKYNIKTVEDAYNCAFLWDINNGITLCHNCHKKTETYGLNKNKHKKIK